MTSKAYGIILFRLQLWNGREEERRQEEEEGGEEEGRQEEEEEEFIGNS